MNKRSIIRGALGVAAMWGLCELASSITEAITPSGARVLHKIGSAVGISIIGSSAVAKVFDYADSIPLDDLDDESDEAVEVEPEA